MVDYAGRQPIIFRAPSSTLDAKAQAELAAGYAAAAQAAVALANQAAGIAAAVANERYYASYAAGNAATSSGEYFAVLGSGSYDFHINGNATPVVKLPVLDGSGRLGVGTATPDTAIEAEGDSPIVRATQTNSISTLYGFEMFAGGNLDGFIKASLTSGEVRIGAGRSVGWNGFLTFYTDTTEKFRITPAGNILPGFDNTQDLGSASFRMDTIFAGAGSINTSDRNAKTEIGTIPDEWLDAWADVEWCRFKMIGGSRWHVGLVAQQVHEAFAAHDIDAFEIGLCCFDTWEAEEAEPAQFDAEGVLIKTERPAREAGSLWGLRYSECEAMEAAYQRRRIAQLEAQVAAL